MTKPASRIPAVGDGSTIPLFAARLLAQCVHPVAAWRLVPKAERVGIVIAYFAAAYVTVLAALLVLSGGAA